jgi:glutathione S-transferase
VSLTLYAHPFSSYCQKVLTALYENGLEFKYRIIGPEDPSAFAELEKLWPLKRFPVLRDAGHTVIETSLIIEHLGLYHPGPVRLIPADPKAALDTRMMDRFFDLYVMTPMQKIVFDFIRGAENRDAYGVREAQQGLETAYAWLDERLASRQWATGDDFSLADCAAGPSLFYSDWVHPIESRFPNTSAYRKRLLARPAFARAVDEARPYRKLFPPGAPDRD